MSLWVFWPRFALHIAHVWDPQDSTMSPQVNKNSAEQNSACPVVHVPPFLLVFCIVFVHRV